MHNFNYFLLAIIVICSATINPIDAIIGNNKELSCDDASLMDFTDDAIVNVLWSSLSLAVSNLIH